VSIIKRSHVFRLVLPILAGFLLYRCLTPGPSEVWKFIPDSATAVVASSLLQESTDSLANLYADLPFVAQAKGTLSLMRWFNESPDQIEAFLKDKTITYAFYPLAGGRTGIVMYLPVKSDLEKKWLDNPKTGSLRVTNHNFQGHSITDISNERSENLFSYIIKNDFLIISQHGELIEDVIRFAQSGKTENFDLLTTDSEKLSIYIHGNSWRSFIFRNELDPNIAAFLDYVPGPLNLKIQDRKSVNHISFLSEDSGFRDDFSLVDGSEGTAFEATGFISQRTMHMIRLSAQSESRFRIAFKKYLKNRRQHPAIAQLDRLAKDEVDDFMEEIGNEVILCLGENSRGKGSHKVVLIKYGDFARTRPFFEKLTSEGGNTELYHGYEIFHSTIPDLMGGLFGPVFKGFDASYITYLEPYLVVGNSASAIQEYLNDHENFFTWKYSPDLDTLGFQKIGDAQLLLASNMKKVRASSARTSLKSSLDDINSLLLGYRKDGKKADVSLLLQYHTRSIGTGDTRLVTEVSWESDNHAVFSVTSNPSTGESGLLLSNPSFEIIEHASSGQYAGKILARLDGPVVGQAYKTDFLNIGRPQYVVSTAHQLYVIDEDENGLITLITQPVSSPVSALYRMNMARESGAHFLVKTQDQQLFGWHQPQKAPLAFGTRTRLENVLSPVISFHKNDGICYLLTQRNGKVLVLNEEGKPEQGFPVDMLSSLGGSFALQQDGRTGKAVVAGVSLQGEFVKISLQGELLERKQLVLPESGCSFRTLFDENLQDWTLLRQTKNRAALLDKEGNEIFELVGLRPNFTIRYHYFGSENRFISVVSGGMLSLFDFQGNRIGNLPIPCSGHLGLTYHGTDRELNIFSQVPGKIQVWSIKLP